MLKVRRGLRQLDLPLCRNWRLAMPLALWQTQSGRIYAYDWMSILQEHPARTTAVKLTRIHSAIVGDEREVNLSCP